MHAVGKKLLAVALVAEHHVTVVTTVTRGLHIPLRPVS